MCQKFILVTLYRRTEIPRIICHIKDKNQKIGWGKCIFSQIKANNYWFMYSQTKEYWNIKRITNPVCKVLSKIFGQIKKTFSGFTMILRISPAGTCFLLPT